jgi:hypothetical protein
MESPFDGGGIQAHHRSHVPVADRVVDHLPLRGGQLDVPAAMQAKHQRTADLITQLSVGLGPVPCLTHTGREGSTAQAGMIGDELPQEGDVCRPDLAPTKAEEDVRHARSGYREVNGTLPFCEGL